MRNSLRFSVLDQSPIPEGGTRTDALKNSLDLARETERFGYERFWIAEHHGTPGLASSSPEVLMGPVAQVTARMKIGSGGIMLPHYSPLKVWESFTMLSALYPGRIDLGVGRAAGTSPKVARLLQRDRRQASPDDFPEQLAELLGYAESAGRSVPVSLLGSSLQSALWAAELGLPYVFADFINAAGAEIAHVYQDRFQPSAFLAEPAASVALWVICAETDAEAYRLSLSARMMLALLMQGRLIPVPSVQTAEEFLAAHYPALERMPIANRRFVVGSPATVKSAVEDVARQYGASEVFAVNIVHDHRARLRSYELLMEAFQEREPSVHSNAAEPMTPPANGPTIGTQNTGGPLVRPLL